MNTVIIPEYFIRYFTNGRVHMYRVDDLNVVVFRKKSVYRSEHITHRFAKVFPTVCR